ncbi:Ger(x)C family spore germination protein [Alkalicoccobacillus porphyridii]|uniref:Ger(X)C family spore germination protein n=1 Tax=Alkalicoccobacillus porphyridii TaxID=2597270 RepID=A0A554A039_9BACI|nr:Ger(x)C family spore germination protein [Alkalicoccobacillus porphyridii]TSB47067.1 Ger(x)C family spore germination protein [Alkalicoccobacillus porphyridii]
MTIKRIFIGIVCMFCLTGCWDSRSIEEISLVIGVGVDISESGEYLSLGHQIIVPPSNSGDSSQNAPFKNIYTTGKTVHSAIRNLALRDHAVISDHQRVLIIRKDVLRKWTIEEVINQMIKDDRTRRSLFVFITDEPIKQVLGVSDAGEIPSNQLYDLIDNRGRSAKILPEVSLGKLSSNLQKGVSFLLQDVQIIDNRLALSGGGVIKDSMILDQELSIDDIGTLNYLTGDIEGGILSTTLEGMPLAFEILDDMNVSIKTDVKDDQVTINVDAETTGRISEDWNEDENSYTQAYNDQRQKAIEIEISKRVNHLVNKLQTDIHADVAGFSEYMRVQQPEFWKQHAAEWDDYFSNADISYSISVVIEDFGTKGSTIKMK